MTWDQLHEQLDQLYFKQFTVKDDNIIVRVYNSTKNTYSVVNKIEFDYALGQYVIHTEEET
jgi:hypothetical protein